MEYTLDAKGKSLGRVASEAAAILRGKTNPNFQPNKVPDIKLVVSNVTGLNIESKKMEQKKYVSHSGYPGSQKFEVMGKLIERKGIEEVFRIAVKKMLPKNRLNRLMMKNLTLKK